eukprot:248183-Chlamydomonas_euryale.AAC.2
MAGRSSLTLLRALTGSNRLLPLTGSYLLQALTTSYKLRQMINYTCGRADPGANRLQRCTNNHRMGCILRVQN